MNNLWISPVNFLFIINCLKNWKALFTEYIFVVQTSDKRHPFWRVFTASVIPQDRSAGWWKPERKSGTECRTLMIRAEGVGTGLQGPGTVHNGQRTKEIQRIDASHNNRSLTFPQVTAYGKCEADSIGQKGSALVFIISWKLSAAGMDREVPEILKQIWKHGFTLRRVIGEFGLIPFMMVQRSWRKVYQCPDRKS